MGRGAIDRDVVFRPDLHFRPGFRLDNLSFGFVLFKISYGFVVDNFVPY